MKKFFRLFAVLAIVAMVFTGCQKEDVRTPDKVQDVIKHGLLDKPIIEGKQYVNKLKIKKKNCDRGIYADHTDGSAAPWLVVDADTVRINNSSKTYIAMKVERSETPGDYFYIMCENLNLKGSKYGKNYIAYDNDKSYAEEYGYCYSWHEANRLASRLYMELPMVYQGVEYPQYKSRCYAHLPSISDMQSIFNITNINGHVGVVNIQNSNQNQKFYDAFVGGLTWENESEYTLVGWADNMIYWRTHNMEQRFFHKGDGACFWTSNLETSNDYAKVLNIGNNATYYEAFFNLSHSVDYGLLVRYVFYPSVD